VKEETSNMQHLECSITWCQNLRHFIKIRNNLKVLKPGAGEGWRRSFGPVCVKNEEVLYRVKEEINILHTIKRRKANWIGHILCRNCLLKHIIGHILCRNCLLKHIIGHILCRNCLLKHIIEGRIQVMGR